MNIDLIQNLVADLASIPQTGSEQGPEGADFDTLLRQQTQASQPQKPQKPTEKPKDKQTAQKPEENSTQEEITEEGYAVAAGLVTSQPVVLFDVLAPEAVQAPVEVLVEEAAPVAAENVAAPVQEILAEDAGVEVQPETETVQAEQQPVPVEEQEALPQTEDTAKKAPEAVRPQGEEAPVEREDAPKVVVHQVRRQTAATEEDAPQEAGAELWTGKPLFQPETAVPVKVADNYEAVPLEEEGAQEQLSNRLTDAIQQGQSRVELQLNPASLGRLTVEITQSENGDISIVFRPETVRAAQILSQSHFTGLMENKDGTFNLSRADIQIVYPEQPEEHPNQFLNPDGQNRQNQPRQQREKKHKGVTEDFIQQLRLGLVNAAEG